MCVCVCVCFFFCVCLCVCVLTGLRTNQYDKIMSGGVPSLIQGFLKS